MLYWSKTWKGSGALPTALITGSTSGLGLSLARELKARGYTVLTTGRSATPPPCSDAHFPLDLSLPGAGKSLFDAVSPHFSIDTLICNAGVGLSGSFLENDPEALDRLLALNIAALTQLVRLFAPAMSRSHPFPARILLISSTGAFLPGPYCAAYYASKAYVLSLARALRLELRPLRIQVSTACPGALSTNFSKNSNRSDPKRAMPPDKAAKWILNGFLRGRGVIVPGLTNKFLPLAAKLLPAHFLGVLFARYQTRLLRSRPENK